MAEELQLRIHTELCKATVENAKLVAKHLKINEEELKDKTKVPIINKIANVIEKELTGVEEEEKVTFLQAIIEILVDTPPPLEEVKEAKSLLISLKKEIEELKLLHKQKTTESESKVDSAKVKQESNSQQVMACHPLCILLLNPRVYFGVSSRLPASLVIQTKKIN